MKQPADDFDRCDATYAMPGKTWADRAARLLDACPPNLPTLQLQQLFEETAGMLEFGKGLHVADAEMKAFGQLLFAVLQLGVDARATP